MLGIVMVLQIDLQPVLTCAVTIEPSEDTRTAAGELAVRSGDQRAEFPVDAIGRCRRSIPSAPGCIAGRR
jgi:hypothetical protein